MIKTIKYNNQRCSDINNLWYALHSTFNTASNHQVDMNILNEITNKPTMPWPVFSKEKFRTAISSCNNSSAPGPDKLLWSYLKTILKDNEYLNTIIHIANVCINLGYWLSHFKISTTVVIPKPNKKLFIFNRKLTFHQHVNFYANKALSTIKYMKMLGNSNRSISPLQKRLLYKSCILPIALYGFQL